MRYLGSKELIISEIADLLEKKDLLNKNLTFFDAFCGTGSVSDALKGSFNIVANDNLLWCVIFTKGRLYANDCKFDKLGFDVFNFFNSNNNKLEGFIYNNYSPGGSNRMYFSSSNAGRIDYFRAQIEEWKNTSLISDKEYCYLLSCLIESVSNVSNTAGVYGAFLKHWDARAKKPILFSKVNAMNADHGHLRFLNHKIEDIISEVECDILYLDPPYTQNQYGTQYHLLETLILNDSPNISPITGSRSTSPMRSDWSKAYKANILFDRILAKSKARYVLLSYSKDGFMSKEFIEASLKRYGKPETFECITIEYRKYKNYKTNGNEKHFEYLFYVEMKEKSKVCYESPLNYIGSKSKMMEEIKRNLPNNIGCFVDAFGGGFNVGVNVQAPQIVYNEINYFVKEIIESFKVNDTYKYLLFMKNTISKFGLDKSNSTNYLKARKYYNSLPKEKRDPKLLFTIMLYGYQQQIRFNSDHNFNNPVGMRWFNDRVLEKMISFSRRLKEINTSLKCKDYYDLLSIIPKNAFVYMDPPYRLTRGSYNDGKRGFMGWTEHLETKLFEFSDMLNKQGNQFMISYVPEHGGQLNIQLRKWVRNKKYRLIHTKPIPGRNRKEVLIVNYKNDIDLTRKSQLVFSANTPHILRLESKKKRKEGDYGSNIEAPFYNKKQTSKRGVFIQQRSYT